MTLLLAVAAVVAREPSVETPKRIELAALEIRMGAWCMAIRPQCGIVTVVPIIPSRLDLFSIVPCTYYSLYSLYSLLLVLIFPSTYC